MRTKVGQKTQSKSIQKTRSTCSSRILLYSTLHQMSIDFWHFLCTGSDQAEPLSSNKDLWLGIIVFILLHHTSPVPCSSPFFCLPLRSGVWSKLRSSSRSALVENLSARSEGLHKKLGQGNMTWWSIAFLEHLCKSEIWFRSQIHRRPLCTDIFLASNTGGTPSHAPHQCGTWKTQN